MSDNERALVQAIMACTDDPEDIEVACILANRAATLMMQEHPASQAEVDSLLAKMRPAGRWPFDVHFVQP